MRTRFVIFLVRMNAALTETFTVQKWRIITFLSMTFLITFGPLAQLALLHSVHDAAAFIRELLSLPRALLSTLSDIMPTKDPCFHLSPPTSLASSFMPLAFRNARSLSIRHAWPG